MLFLDTPIRRELKRLQAVAATPDRPVFIGALEEEEKDRRIWRQARRHQIRMFEEYDLSSTRLLGGLS